MTPPIYLCQRHHDICQACRWQLSRCTVCGTSITNYRDHRLEDVTGYLTFACKNDDCRYICNGIDMKYHEEHCTSRRYECPIDTNCDWYDLHEKLEGHVNVDHAIKTNDHETRTMIVWNRHHETILFSRAHDRFFTITLTIDEKNLNVLVKLIGPMEFARRYTYEITFRDSDHHENMSYVRRCSNLSAKPVESLTIPLRLIQYLKTDVFAFQIKKLH